MNILGFLRADSIATLDAVQYYRVHLPLNAINRLDGVRCTPFTIPELSEMADDALDGYDLVVMSRMYSDPERTASLVNAVHQYDAQVVMDVDDDLTERHRLVSGRGEAFQHALGVVDWVTVTTPYLADYLSEWTRRRPVVLPNQIECPWWKLRVSNVRRAMPGLTMGFSGSPTHWGDWYQAAPALARIASEYSHVVAPLVQGGGYPNYLDFVPRIARIEGTPFMSYPDVLAQFDVLLCAVDSRDPFSRAKSDLKPLEAMASGCLPVCSRFQPYLNLQAAGAPILIVGDDSPDGWYETLRWMVESPGEVDVIREKGAAWVSAHRNMGARCRDWVDAYVDFVADATVE